MSKIIIFEKITCYFCLFTCFFCNYVALCNLSVVTAAFPSFGTR